MRNRRLIILPLLIALLSITLAGCSNLNTFKIIQTSDLQKMLTSGTKFTLVDVREADTYSRGHIAGAINMPASQFEDTYKQLKPDSKIVLICYTGDTSKSAAQFLLQQGYKDVSSVAGGMGAWSGPVVK